MNTPKAKHVFNRSGLAALSDLESPGHQEIFSYLEKEQDAFLDKKAEFRSEEYKWPHDPLHTWSRVWEYPYVYHNIKTWRKNLAKDCMPRVVDVGSGVTFFPFSVARMGFHVTCTDIDQIVEKDLLSAIEKTDYTPGKIDFRLSDGTVLPFSDNEVDVVYCISVLEHIPQFEQTVSEIARILKPDGLCLITCDINLKPDDGLQLDGAQYARLMSLIDIAFVRMWPEHTIHPLNILTSNNSPYPSKGPPYGVGGMAWRLIKQKVLKPLLGRKPGSIRTLHLTVLGLAMKKKI